MNGPHAPLTRTRRSAQRQPPAPPDDAPVSALMLDALRRGEAALTRTAQDERDIETLIQMRKAIRRASF